MFIWTISDLIGLGFLALLVTLGFVSWAAHKVDRAIRRRRRNRKDETP